MIRYIASCLVGSYFGVMPDEDVRLFGRRASKVRLVPKILSNGGQMGTDPAGKSSFVCTIAPWLSVRNSARAVDFYKVAFGATEAYRLEGPDGSVVAKLSVDGAEFWVGDESPEHGNFSPVSLGGGSVRMIFTVADPDAVFAKAIKAGAREVFPVGEEYGWRLGRVVDPFGHHWEIGHPLTD
jgi:PhnB protein